MEWPLFAGVPEENVRELLSVARRRRFEKGEAVFHRGDPADALHLVASGHFAVRILTPLGDTALLAVHGPGDTFGETALLDPDGRRSASVSAIGSGETYAVRRPDYLAVEKRHPDVVNALLAVLAERVRRDDEHIVAAHYLDADERVRWGLLDLGRTFGPGDGEPFTVPLTQAELAELVGVARPTLNRVLRDEQERGTIALERGRVRVDDPAALRRRLRSMPVED